MSSHAIPSDQVYKLMDSAIEGSRIGDLAILLDAGYPPQRKQLIDAVVIATPNDRASSRAASPNALRVVEMAVESFVSVHHGDKGSIEVFEEVARLASSAQQVSSIFTNNSDAMHRPKGVKSRHAVLKKDNH